MLKRAATCVILIGAAASSALASFSSGPSAPPTPPTALGFAHFTTWGLVPFVGAWATWHMMETLRGSLLHVKLRRFGVGLAAPTWARVVSGIGGGIGIAAAWSAWMVVGWVWAMMLIAVTDSPSAPGIGHVEWIAPKTVWIGGLALVAWLSFWLGRAGHALGSVTMGVLATTCLFAGDPIAATLIVLATPAGVGLGLIARRLWPGDKTNLGVPMPPRPLAQS